MTPSEIDSRQLSHEIRNQLALISGHASILQMSQNLTTHEQSSVEAILHTVRIVRDQIRLLVELADHSNQPHATKN